MKRLNLKIMIVISIIIIAISIVIVKTEKTIKEKTTFTATSAQGLKQEGDEMFLVELDTETEETPANVNTYYSIQYMYYGEGVMTAQKKIADIKVVENQVSGETVTERAIDIDGYYPIKEEESLTLKDSGNVITFFYVKRKDLTYEVNYLEKDTNKVINDTKLVRDVEFETKINAENEKIDVLGYKFDSIDKSELTIGTGKNAINIYYTIAEEQTKKLSYTIEYYKDGEKQENDTQKVNQVVQVLQPDSIQVDKTQINLTDKYKNYKLEKTDPDEIPNTVNDGDVIKVYYVVNNVEYSVQYMYYGTGAMTSQKKIADIKVVDGQKQGSTITEKAIDIDGYIPMKAEESLTLKDSGNVITFFYVKRNDLEYKVNYLEKDTNKIISDNKLVQNVEFETKINAENEKIDVLGYKFDSVDKQELTVGTGENIINIYYVVDDTQTKDLSYTIEYYKDGEKEDTEKVTKTVQILEADILEVNKTEINFANKYKGYKVEKTSPEEIPSIVNTGDVIKVYYIVDDGQTKELNYTVEYYKDGTLEEKDTQIESKTVHVLEPDTLNVDVSKINTTNKYAGYKLERTEPNQIPSIVNTGDVIKIYYTKSKDIDYSVLYFYDGDGVTTAKKEIHEMKVVKNQTFEDTVTEKAIEIDGYYAVENEISLKLKASGNVIIFNYRKRDDLSYKVNYLEKDTNRVISESKLVQNVEFETKINAENEKIDVLGYKFDSVDKSELTVGTGENIINIYYVVDKNQTKDLNYTIEYYKDGEKEDTETITKTVQVLEDNMLEVDKTKIYTVSKYAGYKLDKTSPEEIPDIVKNGDIIKVYYEKDKFNYKIEYYYNGQLDSSKTETKEATYQDVIKEYPDKIITGYKLEKTENLPLTITELPVLNIIKVYYIKNEFDYTINYFYDGVLDQEKVENLNGIYQDIVETYPEKLKDGYRFDKTENLPLTITEDKDKNIINVYYVRKDAEVIVKYIDNATNEEISDRVIKQGKVFDEYDVTKDEKDIKEYTLIAKPEPMTGTFTEEAQIKVYKYAKVAQVIVKYLEKDETPNDDLDNAVLSEEVIINGYEGKEYATEQKQIENFTFVESTNNEKGIMTRNTIEVKYYYAQNTKAIANYIDRETGEILEKIEQEGKVGDIFKTEAKDIDNYVLVAEPVNKIVTMTKDIIVLNYYYAHASSGVIEKHIDINSKDLLDNILYEGNEGDSYKTTSKEIEGYDIVTNKIYYTKYVEEYPEFLKENEVETIEELLEKLEKVADEPYIPENAEGKMTIDVIEVKYYYIRKSSVKIQYIDKITDKILLEEDGTESTEVITGYETDPYKTKEKTFKDYVIVKEMYPENVEGKMEKEQIVVKYYYVHVSAGVIEKHIDEITGENLEPETKYEGNEGDEYKINSKTFEGYDLVKNKLPKNAEGKMTKEEIVVEYYYIRKAEIIVEYIDKNTNETLKEIDEETKAEKDSTEKITGHEGDDYTTHEKKFKDYKLVQSEYPTNKSGKMKVVKNEDGTVTISTYVRYYYVYEKAVVIENHIDAITGEKLQEEKVYNGNEGDPYKTSVKEFEGYDVVKSRLPENAEGKMTKEKIAVNYYYARKAIVRIEYIDKATGNKIIDNRIIDGHEGDSYKTEAKNFEGYKLVEKTNNTEGKMTKEEILVKYYYEKKPVENAQAVEQTQNNNNNNNNQNPTVVIGDSQTSQNSNKGSVGSGSSQTYSKGNNSSIPNTGDLVPVIATGTIVLVILMNIITQIVLSLKKKKMK